MPCSRVFPQFCGPVLSFLGAFLLSVSAAAAADVTVNASVTHQTMLGWGAVTPWLMDVPDLLVGQIIDTAVNDLGLTRLRYEGPSGNRAEDRRWEWGNDDDDPLHVNWSAYNTASLDAKVQKYVVPFQQAVQANGDPFSIYLSPSFFNGGSSGSPSTWMLRSPGEYAEYATSMLLRLRDVHNITADYYCICNEAGNDNPFSAAIVGRMIKAVGPRLQQLGLSTTIQFPECVSANTSWSYIQALAGDERVWEHVGLLSYHLYGSNTQRPSIRDFGAARGLPTAQTEYMGLTIDHLYDDLTLGGVSFWELYGQGFPAPDNNRTSFSLPSRYWDMRQVMHYVRPGAVRVDATSNDGTVRSLGFVNDGKTTVVLLNKAAASVAQTVTVTGLPAGSYGVSRSVGSGVCQELGLQTVDGSGQLSLSVPKNAVLTIYPHEAGNLPPTLTAWKSSAAFLKVGGPGSTTLSASATDPEGDGVSYTWSVQSQPAGASAVLANPNAASTAATGLAAPGQYVFNVAVHDGSHTVNRQVALNVLEGNQPPVLIDVHNRLPVQLTLPGSSTTLRSGAWDLEADPLTFQWSISSQPPGANAQLASPGSAASQVSQMTLPGDYVFRIQVSDGTNQVWQELTVPVYPENLHAPFITGAAGAVLPDGHGALWASTGDLDGDPISHWWELVSGPSGADVSFSSQGGAGTEVWTDQAGSYQFQLSVVDRTRYAQSGLITLDLVPEPTCMSLFGLAAAGWIIARRRS